MNDNNSMDPNVPDSNNRIVSVDNSECFQNGDGKSLLMENEIVSYIDKIVDENCELSEEKYNCDIREARNINSNVTNAVSTADEKSLGDFKGFKKNRGYLNDRSNNFLEKFRNKRLESWNPVYTPNYVLFIYLTVGLSFTILGIYLLISSNSVIECKIRYEDPPVNGETIDTVVELKSENCKPSHVNGDKLSHITGDVYLYYRLDNFYQNNRNYILSRSERQLSGEVITDRKQLSSCYPLITDANDNILLPCGIAASALFNDTYSVLDGEGDPVEIDDSAETITRYSDRNRYKNPSQEHIKSNNMSSWLPEDIFPGKIENPHFIVWMRDSAVSNFNKLYGKLVSNKNKLVLPLKISIKNRYHCGVFNGYKYIVISQIKWFGGKNPYFGVLYIMSGTCMLFFFMFFLVKNRINNNVFGDLRFLHLSVMESSTESRKEK